MKEGHQSIHTSYTVCRASFLVYFKHRKCICVVSFHVRCVFKLMYRLKSCGPYNTTSSDEGGARMLQQCFSFAWGPQALLLKQRSERNVERNRAARKLQLHNSMICLSSRRNGHDPIPSIPNRPLNKFSKFTRDEHE